MGAVFAAGGNRAKRTLRRRGGCRVLGGEETAQVYTGEKVFTNFDYLKG